MNVEQIVSIENAPLTPCSLADGSGDSWNEFSNFNLDDANAVLITDPTLPCSLAVDDGMYLNEPFDLPEEIVDLHEEIVDLHESV